jgi:hypothetical protein
LPTDRKQELKEHKKNLQIKKKTKSPPIKPANKKIKKRKSATASKPTIEIYTIQTNPSPVPAGSKFKLEVEYKVKDAAVKAKNMIRVQFGFSILRGTEVLIEKKPVALEIENKSFTTTSEPLNAHPVKGNYTIKVFFKYKGETAEDSKDFKIE